MLGILYTKETTFDELLLNIRKFKNREQIDKKWFLVFKYFYQSLEFKSKLITALKGLEYTNLPEKINTEHIKRLYGTKFKTSVSKLESYKMCPFSFYLKYGLKVKEKDSFRIQPVDTGSFMHEVIDSFFKIIDQKNINIKDIENSQVTKIVELIIEEKLNLSKNYIFKSTPKFIALTKRLKKVILKSMEYIIYGLKNSNFEILDNEAEFGENKKYPSINIKLEDGTEVEVIGKIDRIDICRTEENKYIRIIDYKSSAKNLDLSDVYNGLELQLLTYLGEVTEVENAESAGVLYFNLIDPIVKKAKNLSDEKIEEEIKKQFRMKGLILANVKVARLMDNNLQKNTSDIIPVQIKSDDTFYQNHSSIATSEEFKSLQKYIKKLLKQISSEILTGDISIKPYYKSKKTLCEYCNFKSICQFDINLCGNEYKYIEKYSREFVLKKMCE